MSGYPGSTQDRSSAPTVRVESGTKFVIESAVELTKQSGVKQKLGEGVKNNRDLTYSRVRELLHYDPDTGVVTNRIQRGAAAEGRLSAIGLDSAGYFRIGIDYSRYLLHRVIWLYWYGYIPEREIDHINGNRLDNRLVNLREVSHACNMRNCKISIINTTGIKGVSFRKSKGVWRAIINLRKKHYELGVFTDKIEAVAHRLAAEQCLDWNNCQSNSTAYQFMQNYLKEKRCI